MQAFGMQESPWPLSECLWFQSCTCHGSSPLLRQHMWLLLLDPSQLHESWSCSCSIIWKENQYGNFSLSSPLTALCVSVCVCGVCVFLQINLLAHNRKVVSALAGSRAGPANKLATVLRFLSSHIPPLYVGG